jgi:hypothetical protein
VFVPASVTGTTIPAMLTVPLIADGEVFGAAVTIMVCVAVPEVGVKLSQPSPGEAVQLQPVPVTVSCTGKVEPAAGKLKELGETPYRHVPAAGELDIVPPTSEYTVVELVSDIVNVSEVLVNVVDAMGAGEIPDMLGTITVESMFNLRSTTVTVAATLIPLLGLPGAT